MTYKVGLIGLGKVGATYDVGRDSTMSHLKAVLKDNRFSLNFAYDTSEDNCAFVIENYGLKNIFQNMNDVDKDKLVIDLLVIASPTSCHLESITSLLKLTVPKLILCEKPLAETSLEGHKIAELCSQKQIQIVTNFMRRSLPVMVMLRDKIVSNSTGVHDVVVKYSGCFRNNGSHFVDLMNYFYGAPENIVASFAESVVDFQYKVRAIVKYKNAVCTYIPLGSNSVGEHEVEIMTDEFKLIISKAGRDISILEVCDDTDFAGALMYGKPTKMNTDYLNFQKFVYDDVYMALSSGVLPANLCDIDAALSNTYLTQELSK